MSRVTYTCAQCGTETILKVLDGCRFPEGPPIGWGDVTDYQGLAHAYVCSPACYEAESGQPPVTPPAPGDVEAVVAAFAFDDRQPDESVATWLERTFIAMRS